MNCNPNPHFRLSPQRNIPKTLLQLGSVIRNQLRKRNVVKFMRGSMTSGTCMYFFYPYNKNYTKSLYRLIKL